MLHAASHLIKLLNYISRVTPGNHEGSMSHIYIVGGRREHSAFGWCYSLSLSSDCQQLNPSFPCSLITPGFGVINEQGQSQMPQLHLHLAETKLLNQAPTITYILF